ncbi:MAG: hypothetical protein WAW23_01855 [Candidatus Methanoperedens sp.]
MNKYYIVIFIVVLFSGCITTEDGVPASKTPEVTTSPTAPAITLTPTVSLPPGHAPSTPSATTTVPAPAPTATVQPSETPQKLDEKAHASLYENSSVAVEVNYREYVDWFRNYNLNIRSYTPQEYICGQYTVDMINASEKAGYKAYFAAVLFSDGTGHAIVSFKSTFSGFTSWYFFEPQTNKLLTPEGLAQELNRNMGKIVTEVNIYGYFDDASDNDPSTWRFAYPLYNKKY